MGELSRRRRRAMRARLRSKAKAHDQTDGAISEYRGRESYEQHSPEGRGGQSGMFDQPDYPPRQLAAGELLPSQDDGQLVTPEDRLSSTPPAYPARH
jgi:hypothetical protein